MSAGRILRRVIPPVGAAVVAVAFLAAALPAAFCQQSGGGASTSGKGKAFPQAQSEAATKAAQQKQTASPSNARQTNGAQSGKSATAGENPFPEAQSKAAAKADSGGAESSSPPGGYSSSDAAMPASALGEEQLGSHRRLDSFTRDQTQDGRIADDLKVASFYLANENYRGALGRYQDALQYDPQNDTALYGVAETLCKENRTTEAMAHFESYATNNPQGKYALKAEKMLAHPGKCKHNW